MSTDEVKNKNRLSSQSGKKKRISSRNKGNDCERKYARIFREEFNFNFCKTSRQASRLLDDSKVDLANIPLNVQVKKGYWNVRPKPDQVFKQMRDCLKDNFPPEDKVHSNPKVLIHELDGRQDENILVTMMWKDWKVIYKNHLEYIKLVEDDKIKDKDRRA